eukprot:938375-Pyramimonas_sp.AAC.1
MPSLAQQVGQPPDRGRVAHPLRLRQRLAAHRAEPPAPLPLQRTQAARGAPELPRAPLHLG